MIAACLCLVISLKITAVEMQLNLIPSPCSVEQDNIYQGLVVNCQHQRISHLPLPDHWIPSRTTSLLLAFNSISYLTVDSFTSLKHLIHLRVLDLKYNQITSIEPSTFIGLSALQKLDLSGNQINLDQNALSSYVFQDLGSLLELNLQRNRNRFRRGSFSDSLFITLHGLSTLGLDTFSGTLEFGFLFNNTTHLSTLELSGGLLTITNDSFKSLESIKLKRLIIGESDLHNTESGAFQYLKYLEWYEVRKTRQELKVVLESIAPFVNRNMSRLIIDGLHQDRKMSKWFSRNSILTRHMARYLSNICVENVALTKSAVFVIEFGVLASPVWRKCLKSLDLSGNPLNGEKIAFLSLLSLKQLEFLKATDAKYFTFEDRGNFKIWQPSMCFNKIHISEWSKEGKQQKIKVIAMNKKQRIASIDKAGRPQQSLSDNTNNSINIMNDEADNFKIDDRGVHQIGIREFKSMHVIHVPEPLTIVILNRMASYLFRFNKNFTFIGGERISEFHLADNGIRNFTGYIHGLSNLKLLDISKNIGSILSPFFFDSISSLVHLNMAGMKLDMEFMAHHSNRLFKNMNRLTTLDLSNNKLRHLAEGTFDVNSKLSVLLLAENQFQTIPFNMRYVKQLCLLDMSGNLLRKLSDYEIDSMENHFKIAKSFSLVLNGNDFYCGCDNIRFLSWLQRTKINLDNNGNYSCVSDSGIRTTTGRMKDLEAVWRMCHGQQAFWISLVVVCISILILLSYMMISKFKTQIKALLLKTFWIPYIMKTPMDYVTGVYIGYSDQDTKLACQRICPFIEEKLHLSTYVRHRDLLPASDMAESIMEAVHSSWRVLLLVSKYFLDDPWSYFVLKASIYAVQAENPGLIVLILTDADDHQSLLTKLPSVVLQSVRKESIITMTPQGNISYEDKQALKTALCYYEHH